MGGAGGIMAVEEGAGVGISVAMNGTEIGIDTETRLVAEDDTMTDPSTAIARENAPRAAAPAHPTTIVPTRATQTSVTPLQEWRLAMNVQKLKEEVGEGEVNMLEEMS